MRDLFSFSGRVGRRAYLVTGISLMALKVAVDVMLWHAVTGLWTFPPFAFDLAALFSRHVVPSGPSWMPFVILVWSVPFLWIGTAMTARRAADAGLGRGWAALFLVPITNYALILVLCALPTHERGRPPARAPDRRELPGVIDAALAAVLGAVCAAALVAICVYVLHSYGTGLFIGTPVLHGAVCAFVANRRRRRSFLSTLGIAYASLFLCATGLLAAAMEGAVCILMAAPIAFVLSTMGVLFGYAVAPGSAGPRDASPLALLVPALLVFDAFAPAAAEHEVVSSVEIDAPPDVVWRHVVGFSEIPDPPEGLFRLGLACPVRATIDGRGVGAVRRCEFTTGPFVEPVTVWDEPRRLAFDVASQPRPLTELSPWTTVRAPHLDGWFRSVRGEFRLTALPGGRTRLEGSTWYLLDIGPRAYWDLWADGLVHRIHLRVLRHVRRLSESAR